MPLALLSGDEETAWTPASPTTEGGVLPAAWWNAADIDGLADGDPIASWADSSGNGATMAQSLPASRPLYKINILNGLPVVRFDGLDDYLSAGDMLDIGAGGLTVIALAKKVDTANGTYLAKARAAGQEGRWWTNHDTGVTGVLASLGTGGAGPTAVYTNALTAWSRWVWRVDRTCAASVWLNGALVGSNTPIAANTTNYDTSNLCLMGAYGSSSGGVPPNPGYFLYGDIAQLLVYMAALSDADAAQLDVYLAATAGL